MSQALVLIDTAEVVSSQASDFALTFIESVEYEFVGGGTAVNNF
jgi:hypothetical protein